MLLVILGVVVAATALLIMRQPHLKTILERKAARLR